MNHSLNKINGVIPRIKLEEMYLDYVNNYLTVEKFALDNNLTENQAIAIINRGRYINHNKGQ